MFETIQERRERIMRETARRNARKHRREFWNSKIDRNEWPEFGILWRN